MQLSIRQIISKPFTSMEDYADWLAGQTHAANNTGFKFAYLNGDNKAFAFYIPRPLDRTRDTPTLARGQTLVWISDDIEVNPVVYKTLLIESKVKILEASTIAIGHSIEFKVIPLPFDEYEIMVKPEAAYHFYHLVKNLG